MNEKPSLRGKEKGPHFQSALVLGGLAGPSWSPAAWPVGIGATQASKTGKKASV